ncbi:MAG: nucleotidyltransferase domain-containing protein [Alkalispirochaeta sp.]
MVMTTELIRDAVAAEASGDVRILAVYLLGSGAVGRLRPDSDVDVAVMPVPGTIISALDRADFAHALSYRLGRSVDVGELSSRNLVYANETIHRGVRLYTRDADAADLYAATLLGMYVVFNEGRQEIMRGYTV